MLQVLVSVVAALVEQHGQLELSVAGDWLVLAADGWTVRFKPDDPEALLWAAVKQLGNRYVVTGTGANEVVRLRKPA